MDLFAIAHVAVRQCKFSTQLKALRQLARSVRHTLHAPMPLLQPCVQDLGQLLFGRLLAEVIPRTTEDQLAEQLHARQLVGQLQPLLPEGLLDQVRHACRTSCLNRAMAGCDPLHKVI